MLVHGALRTGPSLRACCQRIHANPLRCACLSTMHTIYFASSLASLFTSSLISVLDYLPLASNSVEPSWRASSDCEGQVACLDCRLPLCQEGRVFVDIAIGGCGSRIVCVSLGLSLSFGAHQVCFPSAARHPGPCCRHNHISWIARDSLRSSESSACMNLAGSNCGCSSAVLSQAFCSNRTLTSTYFYAPTLQLGPIYMSSSV